MIMMNRNELWIGSVFVVEWDLVDTDNQPIDDAVVTGAVSLPSGGSAVMTIDHTPDTSQYRASYQTVMAGYHGYKISASGAGEGAIGGDFTVTRDITGAPAITVDPETSIGLVRLLISDVDEAYPILGDKDITALLGIESGVVKRAAASALETIATSEVLRSKKITTQDLSVDGPAVSAELRARAKELRRQADDERDRTISDDGSYGLDYADLNSSCSWGWWG